MTTIPYNTGKVKIGCNVPLRPQRNTVSDDALHLQRLFLRKPGAARFNAIASAKGFLLFFVGTAIGSALLAYL